MPVFPKFLQDNNAGGSLALGLLLSSFSLTQAIFSPIYGRLSDKQVGRKFFILLAMGGYAVGNLLYVYVAHDLPSMLVVRVFEGMVIAGLLPSSQALVTDLSKPSNRGRLLGVLSGIYMVGWIVGPFFGGLLYDLGGYAFPFLFSALAAGLGFLVALFFVPETRGVEKPPPLPTVPILTSASRWRAWHPSNLSTFFIPGGMVVFAALTYINFVDYLSWAILEPGVSFYVYDELGFSPTDFGLFIASYGLAVAVFQLLLGGLSDKVGRRLVLAAGGVVHFAGYFVLLFANSFLTFILFAMLAGVAVALIQPSLIAFVGDVTASDHRGQVMGLLGSVVQLAGVIGPVGGGYLAELFPVTLLFWISALLSVTITAVIILTPTPTRPLPPTGLFETPSRT